MPEKSRLRRSISKWANTEDQHARELRKTYAHTGVLRIEDAAARCGP